MDIYTWDQIYTIVADALGVDAKLVHVPSELFPVVAPDWFWSDLLVGDLAHSARIRQCQDPPLRPKLCAKADLPSSGCTHNGLAPLPP